MAEQLDVQKRKLEEVADVSELKRVAAGESVPVAMQVDASTMKTDDFNMDLLRIYYDRLFPFLKMYRWLSYKSDSTNPKDFFLKREFTFVLQGDVFCRYMCFRDVDEFKSKVLAQQPIRMEIGAVFTHPPKNHATVLKDAYKPIERELVFDIDMDDYDDIRTCCTGAKICSKCWTFMKIAIRVLDRALREDFGFQHFFFVYSGRRGVHCWVCDKSARCLSNEQRSAVAEYLNIVAQGANRARAEIRMNGCAEIHPSVTEAHKICEKYFRDDPNGVLQGQDILNKNRQHIGNILETLLPTEREAVSKFLNDHPDASSHQIWLQLEKLQNERLRNAGSFRQKSDAKLMLKEVVLQYAYPRLDINVSKQMNHLLKAPFVVHPKTGRVCVPIDPSTVETFDPQAVPTVGCLVDELNKNGGDPLNTSLKAYTHWFETKFLQPMEGALAKSSNPLDW